MRTLCLFMLLTPPTLLAQATGAHSSATERTGPVSHKERFNFVAPGVPGRVVLPPQGTGWQAENVALYDAGKRPAIQMKNLESKIELSVVLFPNDTGQPSSVSCRDAVLDNVLSSIREHAAIEDEKRDIRSKNGIPVATASYLIARAGEVPLRQQNVFAFIGSADTCAELHLSQVRYVPEYAKGLNDLVDQFSFDPAYKPTSEDYSTMGSLLYSGAQDYASSAVYFQRALDTVPSTASADYRHFVTDQLGMSLGIAGDADRSRKVFETAIAADPEYPMYPYNLACGYAEQGNAALAQKYLQQAFDRRNNTIPGETFPDPAKDDSFLKLKSDPAFWSFVTGLSRQLKK